MNYLVYQFEAVSIQEYILATAKLKEMVQGSQLLEALTEKDILNTVLKAQGLTELPAEDFNGSLTEDQIVFPRRAGGVFLAIMKDTDKAKTFCQSWELLVQQIIPGLTFSSAYKTGNNIADLVEEVRQKLNTQKNQPRPTLPEISPIAQRNQRSGEAVVKVEKNELYDLTSNAKHQTEFDRCKSIFTQTLKKWLPEALKDSATFPTCFDHLNRNECKDNDKKFPFSGNEGEHYVAVVHADGNGMGQYIKSFMESIQGGDFVSKYAQFSQLLEDTTTQAAQTAITWLHNQLDEKEQTKPLPIRPLVLSGDDVAFIIRADYALGFMTQMTQAFERLSEQKLKELNTESFPSKLTLTSGMVFLRSNQPFYMAYHLAEDLCGEAKEAGRKHPLKENSNEKNEKEIYPSLCAFHLITNTLFEDAETQIKQELTVKVEGKDKKLTCTPYALTAGNHNFTNINALKALADCFGEPSDKEAIKVSFIRELATYLHTDPKHAKRMLERWQKLNETKVSCVEKALEGYQPSLSLNDLVEGSQPVPIADLILWKSMNTQF